MNNTNLKRLIDAAERLRPLLGELVFVGGAVTGLLITDEAAADSRVTFDVDAVAEITSYAEYTVFGERLRELGFREDVSEDAPLCRWLNDQVVLDVMALDSSVLGFSNRWYQAAINRSRPFAIRPGLAIRVVSAPIFIATKLEAFRGRGHADFLASKDLEDIVSVIDGRPSLTAEIESEPGDLRTYLRLEIQKLLENTGFFNALPGLLLPDAVSQSRIGLVLERLRTIAR